MDPVLIRNFEIIIIMTLLKIMINLFTIINSITQLLFKIYLSEFYFMNASFFDNEAFH